MSMKNLLTPAGIETAIFRFVAQYFNHCAAVVFKEHTKIKQAHYRPGQAQRFPGS